VNRTIRWLTLVSLLLPTLTTGSGADSSARIVVGPNILVSRDGDFPHIEPIVAANPADARNLLGGAITATRPAGGMSCRAYASHDGGNTWIMTDFPDLEEHGAGDPYVAFTLRGTGIFTALADVKDETGRTRSAVFVRRSEDGGMNWRPTIDLGYSYDHEQITVDQTTGKYAGRIYIGVLHGYPEYKVGVFRSEDDGRTWIGPVQAASGRGEIGINDIQPMVLSDGTLVMPYADFEFLPGKRKTSGLVASTAWMVLSEDGGVSFGAPRKIVTHQLNLDDKAGRGFNGFPAFAVDNRSEPFRDRIYVAWADDGHGPTRVYFSSSDDRGQHWTEPKLLDPTTPAHARQGQAVLAVNKDGVVGATWYDTREASDGQIQFHEYFTASTDGGKTFLPPVRVSSAISNPQGAGNLNVQPSVQRSKQYTLLELPSAAFRWPTGGDYVGLAADSNGVFHPFWADARTGTFQIYTAAVSVVMPSNEKTATTPPSAPVRTKTVLDTSVEFVFDPSRFDAATNTVEIPMRIRNLTKRPIYPPITVEILGMDNPDPDIAKYPYPPTFVVGAMNGKPGAGATFDFSHALGNLEALEPGAQTGPVVLKFRFENPMEHAPIWFKVEGMVEGEVSR
jgi:hypothetical protein